MPSTIERALELARAGSCRSINDIKARLRKERYENIDTHLSGRSIQGQLNAAIKGRAT